MSTIEVGLGDSPQRIAHRMTGDPRRYQELLASNPHKSLVYDRGVLTFASLGVGEQLAAPSGWLGAPPSAYAQSLAAVGLHPDNPDEMYKNLILYLANPKAFKDRDSMWPGKRDNLSWWEDPKGTATLNWPFHGGLWYDNVPKNDAQLRAVFKVPQGVSTKAWLSKAWGFPMSLAYRIRWEPTHTDGFDLFKSAGSLVDAAGNFIRSIPGVKEAIKLEIDLDFAALGALVNIFVPSPGSDILHGLSSVAQDEAKRAVDGLNPKPPNEIVDTVLNSLNFLGEAKVLAQYLVHRMLSTNQYDAAFFANLFTFQPDPNDPAKLAEKAQLVWSSDLDPTLRKVIPPLSRLIVGLATTGKVLRSDLLAMVGDNDATRKVLDLFGVHDSAPVLAPPPAPTPHPAAAAAPAPKKTIALKLPPSAAASTVPAPQLPASGPTPPAVLPPPGPPSVLTPPGPPAVLTPPGPPTTLAPPGPPAALPSLHAGGGAYEPYATHGALSAPPPPPGHHPGHPGHSGHPHGGRHPHSGRGGFRGEFWPSQDTYATEVTCTSWGFPAPMHPDLDFAGKRLLSQSSGQPVSGYVNGVLYLFSFQDGTIRARPCAAVSSTLGDAPGASILYYLYRTTNPSQGWTAVGPWASINDAEQQMTTLLMNAPGSQLGAYVWDGKNLNWKFF